MTSQEWQRWWQRDGAPGLRALLLQVWDPIGVRIVEAAHDEYDAYVRGLGPRLRRGADAPAVAAYLSWAQDRMGLPRSAAELRDVADRITAWYAQSTGDGAASAGPTDSDAAGTGAAGDGAAGDGSAGAAR